MEENKNNNLIGVVVTLILVCSLAFNIYSLVKKPEVQKCETETQKETNNKNENEIDNEKDTTPDETECVTTNEITSADIKSIYKSYMVGVRTVDFDNLQSWNLNDVTYLGYMKNTNTRVYSISGTYSCKDKSSDCVYQEQTGSVAANGEDSFNNSFDVEVAGDGSLTFKTMDVTYGSDANFVKVNEKLKS